MTVKIYLPVVEPDERDSVIAQASPDTPHLRGDEDENLACSVCKTIVGRNVSTRTIYQRFRPVHRLIFKCYCGAYLAAPSNPVP